MPSRRVPPWPPAKRPKTREALKAQSEEIRQKIADGGDADGAALKKQLQETQTRLSRLENEGRVAETIVHTYGSSICLLHVVVEFHDQDSGELIRISPDADRQDAGGRRRDCGGRDRRERTAPSA